MDLGKEKRWLVVTQDGRHVTMGRASDPTPKEIEKAGGRLDDLDLPGWLVVSEGSYYSNQPARLMMVRRITRKEGDWSEAEKAWHVCRNATVQGMPDQ